MLAASLALFVCLALVRADERLVRVQYQSLPVPGSHKPSDLPDEQTIEGRVLLQALDGGLLIEDRLGGLWPITAKQVLRTEVLSESFIEFSEDELSKFLLTELGSEFTIHRTSHYVICSSANADYAQWCGKLLERLHLGFDKFWSDRIPDWNPPKRPLTAILFASREQFEAYLLTDTAGQATGAQGYYSVRSNRMLLYPIDTDLTGVGGDPQDRIQRDASRYPAAISTVIHEAVHQLAFNYNLQTRYADNPVWFSEGLAMYFETPDLDTHIGWRSIGKINPVRLDRYRSIAQDGPVDLKSLIAVDDRFRDPQTAIDAYAEAWALHFFLIRTQKERYLGYLNTLREKSQLKWDTPEQRVADFEAAFGPLELLERSQRKYILKLRGGR